MIRFSAFCLGHVLQFCSQRCSDRYFKEKRMAAQQEEARKGFFKWLHAR
jgi:hypothetical protein